MSGSQRLMVFALRKHRRAMQCALAAQRMAYKGSSQGAAQTEACMSGASTTMAASPQHADVVVGAHWGAPNVMQRTSASGQL